MLTGFACILLSVAAYSSAATQVINFGGNLGFVYSPDNANVNVGDTIEWKGDFTMHPLSSVSVPAGAATFHNATGTDFKYVITAPGTYNYHCDIHFPLGMTGKFTAKSTGVQMQMQNGRSMEMLSITRSSKDIFLNLNGAKGPLSWAFFDTQGHVLASGTAVDGSKTVRIGITGTTACIYRIISNSRVMTGSVYLF